MMTDTEFMKQALRLAAKGAGYVSPNPMVGAVIVKEGQVIAQGYHRHFGGPHAEVNALRHLDRSDAQGATMFVTLEPCAHHGKTPPCVHLILDYGLSRVVVAMEDPNPKVRGKGIQILKQAGIAVQTGLLVTEARALNAPYIKVMEQGKPFITLKVAQTLDGKVATSGGASRWITSEISRRRVHKLRKSHDAILVGVNTVIRDDPQLTVRHVRGTHPRRIILDSRLRIPDTSRCRTCCDPHLTILATTSLSSESRRRELSSSGHHVWLLPFIKKGEIDLSALWERMVAEDILSVLVEGGKKVFTSVIRSGETDRFIAFIAPKLFGSGIEPFGCLDVDVPDDAFTFEKYSWKRSGNDIVFEGWC